MALSTCEAEYNATTKATCDATWMRHLYEEIFQKPSGTTKFYMDNNSAIMTAESQGYTPRHRHYLLRNDFLRECVQRRELTISYVPTNLIIADGFTKALTRTTHGDFTTPLNLLKQDAS